MVSPRRRPRASRTDARRVGRYFSSPGRTSRSSQRPGDDAGPVSRRGKQTAEALGKQVKLVASNTSYVANLAEPQSAIARFVPVQPTAAIARSRASH